MTPHQPITQLQAAVATIMPRFFDFFERVYQLTIPAGARQPIEAEIMQGLANSDRTVNDLIAYVHELQKILQSSDPQLQPGLHLKARETFRRQFQHAEANSRGRTLAVLRAVLEQIVPGSTGTAWQPPFPGFGSPVPATGANSGPAQDPDDPMAKVPEQMALKRRITSRTQALEMELYQDEKIDGLISRIWRS